MTFLYQLGVVPAILVTLAGMLVLDREDEEKSGRRFLIFLLAGQLLLLSAVSLIALGPDSQGPLAFQVPTLLTPVLMSMLALILLNLSRLKGMPAGLRSSVLFMGIASAVLLGLLWNSRLAVGYLMLPGALALVFLWLIGRRKPWLPAALGAIAVGSFMLFQQVTQAPPQSPPRWLSFLIMSSFFLAPAMLAVMPALLITRAVQKREGGSIFTAGSILQAGLAIAMLGFLAYVIVWGGIWDQTEDMGYGFMLAPIAGTLAIGAGMLAASVRGGSRRAGLLYMLLVPVVLFGAYDVGQKIPHHNLTDARAGRISHALENYHQREGRYPEKLDLLVPRDLLFVPQPVILMGERWCYEGSGDTFSLAAFYREFWGAPLSLKIYASAGQAAPAECEKRLAEMKKKYYSPMEDPAAMQQPPLPTPLPEIEVEVPKIPVDPVLEGAQAVPGSWSPDSAYFVFGTGKRDLSLHFLDGKTGAVCTADGKYAPVEGLRENHAWIPDGRLLYVSAADGMLLMNPCGPGVERLISPSSEPFTGITAYGRETGRLLLQSKSRYWILDGRSLRFLAVTGVSPTSYELHWDQSAWLPGGEELAIARLDGRKGSGAGSTLFLVDGLSGRIDGSLQIEGEFGQSAPPVEGLSDHEVLVYAPGKWMIVDFSARPPRVTDVLKDILGLDIASPEQTWASGAFVDRDSGGYYLAVRLNHPRSQATYLYSSRTGEVHVYNHEHHTLLLFPDGALMEMAKQQDVLQYVDEYDIVLADQPEAAQPHLKLGGHTPREYPHLSLQTLAGGTQLVAASAHGISLVSLQDGKMLSYWTLTGEGFSPWLIPSPDRSALVATMDFGGLYFIPLAEQK